MNLCPVKRPVGPPCETLCTNGARVGRRKASRSDGEHCSQPTVGHLWSSSRACGKTRRLGTASSCAPVRCIGTLQFISRYNFVSLNIDFHCQHRARTSRAPFKSPGNRWRRCPPRALDCSVLFLRVPIPRVIRRFADSGEWHPGCAGADHAGFSYDWTALRQARGP